MAREPQVSTTARVGDWTTPTPQPQLDGSVALSRLPDRDLLYLLARGDLHALEAIYDRHIDAAWTMALNLSETAAAAEQAVAAAFLRVWRQPEPGGHASLTARLLSSVRREALGARTAARTSRAF